MEEAGVGVGNAHDDYDMPDGHDAASSLAKEAALGSSGGTQPHYDLATNSKTTANTNTTMSTACTYISATSGRACSRPRAHGAMYCSEYHLCPEPNCSGKKAKVQASCDSCAQGKDADGSGADDEYHDIAGAVTSAASARTVHLSEDPNAPALPSKTGARSAPPPLLPAEEDDDDGYGAFTEHDYDNAGKSTGQHVDEYIGVQPVEIRHQNKMHSISVQPAGKHGKSVYRGFEDDSDSDVDI